MEQTQAGDDLSRADEIELRLAELVLASAACDAVMQELAVQLRKRRDAALRLMNTAPKELRDIAFKLTPAAYANGAMFAGLAEFFPLACFWEKHHLAPLGSVRYGEAEQLIKRLRASTEKAALTCPSG
jgi:hypothetical protein